jgi:hypothetical protein
MKKLVLMLKSKNKHRVISNDYLIGEFLLAMIIILLSILFPLFSKAQKDKDGTVSYSPGSSTTYIFNRYSALSSTASSGATSVTVSNITELAGSYSFTNSVNVFATSALSAGDLVMIIQVQGADITTTDDPNYGNITAYNGVGSYELRTVLSISTNTITFCTALSNTYTVSGRKRAQVVRVPRLTNLTLGSNAIVSAYPWSGTVGGICALEVNGNTTINGSINATGTGFSGGVDPDINSSSTAGGAAVTLYRTTTTTSTAGKGESIAGNSTDYNSSLNGAYGRGAPANGGGGGNGHNAGGGGGANALNAVSSSWNGTGIKPSGYNSAWNLESASFASDISWGGGRGGYTYGANNANATTQGPGNAAWSGDNRQNVGGFGGRPLDFNSNTRLFLGGGGGSGDGNNAHPGAGGNGGGIVYLLVAGTISGSGSIVSNGSNGVDATGADDGPGGGGGGGAIAVLSNSTISGISITANGGNGGNQPSGGGNQSEGPGGGGGGGYVLTTSTSITITVNGGANGTTLSSALTEFPPNGATKGDVGTKLTTGTYAQPNDCWKEINGFSSVSCTGGTGSISASATIINSYYPGTATASVGATKISVGSQYSGGSTAKILPGDLLLVIQMQGSTINSTNTSAYGSGGSSSAGYLTSVAGTYEYVYAASGVVSNTVYLATPLRNTYTYTAYSGTAGQYSFQVVRVPEYSSLTISSGASISVAEWNGSCGGIIAANVLGTMTLSGGTAIDASYLGFRGGGGRQLSGGSGTNTDRVTLSSNNANGSKGEGIAGTPKYTRSLANTLVDNGSEGYPNGSYAIGAPGNAGGGGTDGNIPSNDQNTGGGGGGNGGAGGQGGAGWANNAALGGKGGAASSFIAATRLTLGGGGGSGTTNNGTGPTGTAGFSSSGGSGGGMIFLKVNAISGSGTINANGATGLSVDNDGGGGGGAGGSVYIYSANTAGLASVTINAKGGNGGNAWASAAEVVPNNDGNPEHGPGGGGGGGVIYSNGTINAASSVAGGISGTTTTANLPYFATDGTVGIKLTSATNPITAVKTFCDVDDDNDGIIDAVENPSGVEPYDDADNDGIPNVYDAVSGTVVAWADTTGDGINDNFDADKDGKINELDIDSDNDGITDNVEAQSTTSYKVPTDVDTDGDGLADVYELPAQIGVYGGNGLTPVDTDGDGTPDYLDTDTDNDLVPDRNEGDRNSPFVTVTQATIDASGDTDGDGLMDIFDNVNRDNLTTNYYTNVTMGNMGAATGFTDNFSGPTPSGSLIGLQKSDPSNSVDRDWRNASILPLHILGFIVNYQSPVAVLKWDVVNELQTDFYEIELSTNGVDFVNIQSVHAKNIGNTSYSFNHNISNYANSTFYYKIKQIDKNGKVFYSGIAVLKIAKNAEIVVSPNPFKTYLNISYNSSFADLIHLKLLSSEGKIVKTLQLDIFKGSNSLQMSELDKLPAGIYFLQIESLTGTKMHKVIKY